MNNNLLELFSMLSSGFGQNKNDAMANAPMTQNVQKQGFNPYGQSFPDEAYQNGQNNMEANNFSMNPNMLSMLLSMLNKNVDLSALSSVLSNKTASSDDGQKKSPPQDDDIII